MELGLISFVGGAVLYALAGTVLVLVWTSPATRRNAWPFAVSSLFFLALTQHPFPDPSELVCPVPNMTTKWQPFRFIGKVVKMLEDGTLSLAAVRHVGLMDAIMNLVVCIVIGWTALPVLRRPWVIVALGGLSSLLIELTQLTGTWGLYPCPYREFDVDDLILNTAGVAIGTSLRFTWMSWRSRRVNA